ncbi:PucR family transcriptional regulator [Haloechinothrix salitolerans]|uniref:PucR family transcriptional regulator n=1 Tax=Haloechinothrix salitolerans TaxID=926830 RepID=A0ABW2C2N9_9PSEU
MSKLAMDHAAEVLDVADQGWRAGQDWLKHRTVADGEILADLDRRFSRNGLMHWVQMTIANPGSRVEIHEFPELEKYSRDLALRGIDPEEAEAWRALQRVVLHWWISACFTTSLEPDEMRELIEVSVNSLNTYQDDLVDAIAAHVEKVRDELAGGPQVQRLATAQLILQGAPITRARAEAQLGYPLTGHHVAAIVWVDSEDDVGELELAAEQVMRACGAQRRLTLVAAVSALWIWLPVAEVPSRADLEAHVAETPGVRVVLGRPGVDVNGFRRSHIDAVAAQRLLSRLGSRRRVVRFGDVQMISLLTSDIAEAEQFVADTLGALATADPELRHTVRVFIAEQFNASRAAETLFAHRNTIDRRLARVEELLPRPLGQDPAAVDAALALLELKEGR